MQGGIVATCWGWVPIGYTNHGISFLDFPGSQGKALAYLAMLGVSFDPQCGTPLFDRLQSDLKQYFSGQHVDFSAYPLDIQGLTPFRHRVYQVCRDIGYGETMSYGQVADAAGCRGGARAVGQALKANSIPIIIPCHRVVAGDGSLGGFTGGVEKKERLLMLERAQYSSCELIDK